VVFAAAHIGVHAFHFYLQISTKLEF
jgi:hypothetical protein